MNNLYKQTWSGGLFLQRF